MKMDNCSLTGLRILVTRPVHQMQKLCELIQSLGGDPIAFPTLEIADPSDKGLLLKIIDQLAEVELAIFISPNAVFKTAGLIQQRWPKLPPQLRLIALGAGTAQALREHNLSVDFCPDKNFNSEGVLALPVLQKTSGKVIAIFRGEGGRDILANTLIARGAQVVEAIAYRRLQPNIDVRTLLLLLQQGQLDVVMSTSQESLKNLLAMAGAEARLLLLQIPILVISPRLAELVKELGFMHAPIVAESASDEAIIAALKCWKVRQL